MEHIIQGMKILNPSSEFMVDACNLLWVLCSVDTARAAILNGGALEQLFRFIDTKRSDGQVVRAVFAVLSCAVVTPADVACIVASGLRRFVAAMKAHVASVHLQRYACTLFASLAQQEEARAALLASNVLSALQDAKISHADSAQLCNMADTALRLLGSSRA